MNNAMLSSLCLILLMVALVTDAKRDGGTWKNLNGPCPVPCVCKGLTVNCKNKKLTQVPSNLPTNVERLNLGGNDIQILHRSSFRGLRNLKQLHLYKNKISAIQPGTFKDLINLRRLRLNNNKIGELSEHLFVTLGRLNSLDLSNNELHCVGREALVGLSKMKSLHLAHNKITWIAAQVFQQMPLLTMLRLSDNPFRCNCHLRWLSQFLSRWAASGYSLVCHSPPSLRGHEIAKLMPFQLDCTPSERVQSINQCLINRCSVHCVCSADGVADCNKKGLSFIPMDLPITINEIQLQYNEIEEVPARVFSKYPNLKKIFLNGNKIRRIAEDAFASASRVTSLYLNSNEIRELPVNLFKDLSSLQILYLHKNNLSCIPRNVFKSLPNLYILHLSQNNIKSLENGTFDNMKMLKYLYLVGNPFICDCNLPWLSGFLSLREGGGHNGPFASCSTPHNLIGTHIRDLTPQQVECAPSSSGITRLAGECRIQEICPLNCRCADGGEVDCSNLGLVTIPNDIPFYTRRLNLRGNKFSSLDKLSIIAKLTDLETLDLSNNKISRIEPGALQDLKLLEKLDLSNNQLGYFDENAFKGLSNLQQMFISGNNISCLNKDAFQEISGLQKIYLNDNQIKCIMEGTFDDLKKLKLMNLSGNPLKCNCRLSWMTLWLRDHVTLLNVTSLPTCAQPALLQSTPVTALDQSHFVCEAKRKPGCGSETEACCTKDALSCDPRAYCPPKCKCEGTTVRCNEQKLTQVPADIPADTTDLYLERNSITQINDSTFAHLTKLQTLVLSYNAITELGPNVFSTMKDLKTLILSFNKLQCIDSKAFIGLKNLKALILLSNDLSTIPYGAFSQLINLNNIALSQNPFYCDCNLKWLKDFFHKSFLDNGIALCAAPTQMRTRSIYHAQAEDFVCIDPVDPTVAAKCNACLAQPCQHEGRCSLVGYRDYQCHCQQPFHGRNCEQQINACFGQPCKNGGTCKFTDNFGNFECICPEGFSGSRCTVNIDECVDHKCLNGATCVDLVNNYTCKCPDGFRGELCEEAFQYCRDSNPCENGGQCVAIDNSYQCVCRDGWQGKNCDTNTDDCLYHRCLNGAACVDEVNAYSCSCRPGYNGKYCQNLSWSPPNPMPRSDSVCSHHQCKNGARCLEIYNQPGYTCQCLGGYSGEMCDQMTTGSFSIDSFVGIRTSGPDFLVPQGNITLHFATSRSSGVLLYYGGDSGNDSTQHLAIDLFNGHVRVSYSLAGEHAGSEGYSAIQVNDSIFRKLEIKIYGENATLYLDNNFQSRLRTAYLPSQRYLKLNQPVYIGGGPKAVLKPARKNWRVTSEESFGGCIKAAYINAVLVNFAHSTSDSFNLRPGCPSLQPSTVSPPPILSTLPPPPQPNPCEEEPCENGGNCIPGLNEMDFRCQCPLNYGGNLCEAYLPPPPPIYTDLGVSGGLPISPANADHPNNSPVMPQQQQQQKKHRRSRQRHTGGRGSSSSGASSSKCRRETSRAFMKDAETGCISRRKIKMRTCVGTCTVSSPLGSFTNGRYSPDLYQYGQRGPGSIYTDSGRIGRMNGSGCCQAKGYKRRTIGFICLNGRVYDKSIQLIRKCACAQC